MSRILEALRKSDAGHSAPAERPRYAAATHAVEAPPAELAREAAAPLAVPAPSWAGTALPAIPDGFRPELAGLRLHVETALADRQPHVLLLTSSTSGEGTTTVAASF